MIWVVLVWLSSNNWWPTATTVAKLEMSIMTIMSAVKLRSMMDELFWDRLFFCSWAISLLIQRQGVPNTPRSVDELRLAVKFIDFIAQIANIDIDHVGLSFEIDAPHEVE